MELHFSPGAYTCCDTGQGQPQGMGYRPNPKSDKVMLLFVFYFPLWRSSMLLSGRTSADGAVDLWIDPSIELFLIPASVPRLV